MYERITVTYRKRPVILENPQDGRNGYGPCVHGSVVNAKGHPVLSRGLPLTEVIPTSEIVTREQYTPKGSK